MGDFDKRNSKHQKERSVQTNRRGGGYCNPWEETERLLDTADHSRSVFVIKYFFDEAARHLENGKETLFDINVKGIVKLLLSNRSADVISAFRYKVAEQNNRFFRKLVMSIARQFPEEMEAAASNPTTYVNTCGDNDWMLYRTLPLRHALNHEAIEQYALPDSPELVKNRLTCLIRQDLMTNNNNKKRRTKKRND